MSTTKWLNTFALGLAAVAVGLVAFKNYNGDKLGHLLNVSYDPTREVYKEINAKFILKYEGEVGHRVSIEQSHGGSSRQARAVADGLAADVVTLALPSDIEILAKRGLIAGDWTSRFPHHSQPYSSTIVFVVRKTNPKQIKDWPDLIGPDITIVTPDPKTSGNGKLSLLAAWGSVIRGGGSEDQAREFVTKLYQHVISLGQGARDSSTTFALAKEGDVHLTWENEALREVAESKGELEVEERVVRERQPDEPRSNSLLIYDLEGELFFGAAPELDHYLDNIKQETIRTGIQCVVLRLRRTRNPDVVAIEHLEHFLRDAEKRGVVVLLAAVRADLAKILRNVRFQEWLPTDHIYAEKNEMYSATLNAVRHAYQLLNQEHKEEGQEAVYYLV
jgi:sulfate/thiosulfate-binding protein